MDLKEFRSDLEKYGLPASNLSDDQLARFLKSFQTGYNLFQYQVSIMATQLKRFIKSQIIASKKSMYGGYLSNNHRRMNGKAALRFKHMR